MLIAKEGNDFEPISTGLKLAVCNAIYDLGTQKNETFGIYANKILIGWELPNEQIDIEEDGISKSVPRVISKMFTLSLHKKANLRSFLESWRGKQFTKLELDGFDIKKLINVPCQLNIIHDEKNNKTYANISTIVPAPVGTIINVYNGPIIYEIEDRIIPDKTPEWIEKIIKKSLEWQHLRNEESNNDNQDDLPF